MDALKTSRATLRVLHIAAPTLYDAFESSLFVSILPFGSNILHQPLCGFFPLFRRHGMFLLQSLGPPALIFQKLLKLFGLHLHCLLSLQSHLVLLGLMAPSQPYSVNEAAPIALRPFPQLQLDGFMATIAPCAVLGPGDPVLPDQRHGALALSFGPAGKHCFHATGVVLPLAFDLLQLSHEFGILCSLLLVKGAFGCCQLSLFLSNHRLAMSLVMPGEEAAVLQSLAFALHPAKNGHVDICCSTLEVPLLDSILRPGAKDSPQESFAISLGPLVNNEHGLLLTLLLCSHLMSRMLSKFVLEALLVILEMCCPGIVMLFQLLSVMSIQL
mmetsp:Transcript_36/g.57  ORF Transcript_36/g.57 Transcript_36/m.57 type:complete len:328 (-) Transcript_36:397-1380(-)